MPQMIDQSTILHEIDKIDSTDGWRYANINGTKTIVYTKYFTGTLDNDSTTDITHNIADFDKILLVTATVWDDGQPAYLSSEFFRASSANASLILYTYSTTVSLSSVGTNLQGNNYRVRVDYYL